jgi:hypothetical protein
MMDRSLYVARPGIAKSDLAAIEHADPARSFLRKRIP